MPDVLDTSSGRASLADIVAYLRVPKRDRDIALQGYTLAMLLGGEMVDGIQG